MKINVLVRFFIVISLFFSVQSMVFAEANLYRGLVLASGSNEAQLRKQALEQVLVKVSGNKDIIKLDESKALGRQVDSILNQFGYQEIANTSFYYAQFEQQKIDDALMSMQQPIWGETRPVPLVWLVNENRDITSEYMIISGQDSAVSWGLKKEEFARGVTVQFPLVDLDDALAVSASDIRGRFYQNVAQATTRYGANYFVLADLAKTSDGKWQLKWDLVSYTENNKQTKVLIKQVNTGTKSYVAGAMLDEIADYYAKEFAILESNGQKLTQKITINNIDSLAKLTRLNTVLSNLNAIASFETVKINKETIEILVTLKGGLTSLKNALNAQPNLHNNLLISTPYYYVWRE